MWHYTYFSYQKNKLDNASFHKKRKQNKKETRKKRTLYDPENIVENDLLKNKGCHHTNSVEKINSNKKKTIKSISNKNISEKKKTSFSPEKKAFLSSSWVSIDSSSQRKIKYASHGRNHSESDDVNFSFKAFPAEISKEKLDNSELLDRKPSITLVRELLVNKEFSSNNKAQDESCDEKPDNSSSPNAASFISNPCCSLPTASNPTSIAAERILHEREARYDETSLEVLNNMQGDKHISSPAKMLPETSNRTFTTTVNEIHNTKLHPLQTTSKSKVFFVKIVPRQNGETLLKTVIESNVKELSSTYKVFEFSQKMYSTDRKEFIERKVTNKQIFYSGKFIEILPQTEMIITVHGSENLLTLNKDNFVAKIQFTNRYTLDTSDSFENMKTNLLNQITITKILEDESINKRNEKYNLFKTFIQERVNYSSENMDCAEDLLQLSTICNHIKKEKYKKYFKTNLILKEIIKNEYISKCVKQLAQELLDSEKDLHHRNKYLPKFSETALYNIVDFPIMMYDIYKSGILNHKNNLKKFPLKLKRLLNIFQIDYLPPIILLSLNIKDIKLFIDLLSIVNPQNVVPNVFIPEEYIQSIWNNFYAKVIKLPKYKSIKQLGPLTNYIYLFLFKSFSEIMVEISSITNMPCNDLLENENGKFRIVKSIKWPEETPINKALEQQYRLIFELMEHYEPGMYSSKNSFYYKFQHKNPENKMWDNIWNHHENSKKISKNRLPWLYILDCSLAHITPPGEVNEIILKFKYSLQKLFAKFLEKAEYDKHESFRIAVHNITRLAAHICNYVFISNYKENEIDKKILDHQTVLMSNILSVENDDAVITHFANLVDVYRIYWKNRVFIFGEILKKCPCKVFENLIENNILLLLLEIVNKVFQINATVQAIIHFFRMFNEFLQHFKGIKLEWLVSEKSLPDSASKKHVKLINSRVKSYLVKNPDEFVETLRVREVDIPRHYMIAAIVELLGTINGSLNKENWSDGDRLIAAGDLFLAIGHSLRHFTDQANYIDFDNFFQDCTFPFSDVLKNSQTYSEFKCRLENVENYYLYTNKQNEIDIDEALRLCNKMCSIPSIKDFCINFEDNLLKICYSRYKTKLTNLKQYFTTSDIKSIIVDMREYLKDILPIDEWTPDFKQSVIPSLLANLAAIWSILQSKDLARIGKTSELHIIQVLCIFRLLGVDKISNGFDKHLAQILTGQGKSIVLGLLSSLLAVTGNESVIACYSEYLAKRDESYFRGFFETLDEFKVKNKVSYHTIHEAVNDFLYVNINGTKTSLRSLISKLILNKLPSEIYVSSEKSKSKFLLIDEVDVFYSSSFCGKNYYPISNVPIPALLEIQPRIWEIVEDGVDDESIILERIQAFINELLKDEKYEDFLDFLENTNDLFKNHLELMINSAIKIYEFKKNNSINKLFKINTEGLISFRNEYGLYVTTICNGYNNIFSYFLLKEEEYDDKDYVNYGYLNIQCGSLSFANLPKEFSKILGVSGTLTTLHTFEKNLIKSYGISTMSIMPSFFGKETISNLGLEKHLDISYNSFRRLKFAPSSHCILLEKESEWLDKIYDSVNKTILDNRAVLVFFETEREMNLFDEKYRSKIDRLHKLTGNEEPSTMEWYVNESGVSKTVTLATRFMGRGVDFKANDLSVAERGGVHAIQTFFSPDVNEEVQIQGRVARKDNEGSYELILCFQHLDNINCSRTADNKLVSSYRELCDVREKLANLKGADMEKNLKKAAEEHDLTMKFLKSFATYTPSKRTEYFLQYPFVPLLSEEK